MTDKYPVDINNKLSKKFTLADQVYLFGTEIIDHPDKKYIKKTAFRIRKKCKN